MHNGQQAADIAGITYMHTKIHNGQQVASIIEIHMQKYVYI